MLVDDYTPTKRLGVEEMEGAASVFWERVEWARAEADARHKAYLGAWIILHLLLVSKIKYPNDLLEMFENILDSMIGGGE